MKKPKILYVLNGFHSGGAEHGLLTLLENGFFESHEIKILAFCQGDKNMLAKVEKTAGKPNVIICTKNPSLSMRAGFFGASKIKEIMKLWQPDVMVLSLKQANIVGRFMAIFHPKITVVSFEHSGKYRSSFGNLFYVICLWLLSWRVDSVWADCKATLDSTRKYFMPNRKRKLFVVTPFVVGKNVSIKNDYKLHKPIKLVAVGRLSSRKCLEVAIEVIFNLKNNGINANLTLIGDGDYKQNLQKIAAELNLEKHVHFAGYISNWVSSASGYDIFIHPSSNEGFAITVAEAMAAGLPVVAANVGGIKDYGQHKNNIWKVKNHSAQEFTNAVIEIIKNSSLRQKIGAQASRDITAQFQQIDSAGLLKLK